ncbi:retinol dehydrogenase 13 isoform X3 [Sciurus carolinensis]|uniref:retinol dehydrogenase 13 isoform X3 n=1 Tax=Sciurus carolinensis TaxID=30640 RepID=UPI001FB3BBD2|nr:retinol dehydrogenase 13 isoform X3 [Sciurus carolinensis]
MNRYLLPASVLGTAVGGAVLLKDYVAGGTCPSKATIAGKTVIVTGANTGIGKQTALELARRGGNVILACRDMEKCEAAARDIRGETLNHRVSARHLDLASLKSIREFAAKVIEEEERVDILVNNAAVMRCPHWTTEDGFEMQFGVNYLGCRSLDSRDLFCAVSRTSKMPCTCRSLSPDAPAAGQAESLGARAHHQPLVPGPRGWARGPGGPELAEEEVQHQGRLLPEQAGPPALHQGAEPPAARHRRDCECSAPRSGQDGAGQTHGHAQVHLLQLHLGAHLLAARQEPPAGSAAQHIPGRGRGTGGCFWKVF